VTLAPVSSLALLEIFDRPLHAARYAESNQVREGSST